MYFMYNKYFQLYLTYSIIASFHTVNMIKS